MPGEHNGRALTVQDVFEAVGANAAGRISDEELLAIEDQGLSGRRRVRRPVHRQHDGDRHGDDRAVAFGTASTPQVDPQKEEIAFRCGEVIMDAVRDGSEAARHRHSHGVRECDCVGGRYRRFDQLRAAPARDGSRGGSRS